MTGLSHQKLGEWLGVSKSLIANAENGIRSLPKAASEKINAMTLLMLHLKAEAGKAGQSAEPRFSNPAKLAARHKEKMEFHQQSVEGLRRQLQKLKVRYPQLNARFALFNAMKNSDIEWYQATETDIRWMEMIEWFSNEQLLATGLEQQDLLQDKIDTHLTYAELHKQRWKMFEEM